MSVFRGCDFGDAVRVRVVVAVTIQRPQHVVCTGLGARAGLCTSFQRLRRCLVSSLFGGFGQ